MIFSVPQVHRYHARLWPCRERGASATLIRRLCSVLACLFILNSISGCAVTQPPKMVVCQVMKPITYSSSGDTAQTISQIKAHNRAWEEICSKLD